MAHELNPLLDLVPRVTVAGRGIVNSISRVAAAAVPPQLFARPTENFSQKAERDEGNPFCDKTDGGEVNSVLDRVRGREGNS